MTKRRPLSILFLVGASVLSGCVSSRARDWAQTAPALSPEIHRTADDVHLGVWPTPPGRDEQF